MKSVRTLIYVCIYMSRFGIEVSKNPLQLDTIREPVRGLLGTSRVGVSREAVETIYDPLEEPSHPIIPLLQRRRINVDNIMCCFRYEDDTISLRNTIRVSVMEYERWIEFPTSFSRYTNYNVPVLLIMTTPKGHSTVIILIDDNIYGWGLLTDDDLCEILSPDPTNRKAKHFKNNNIVAVIPFTKIIMDKLLLVLNERLNRDKHITASEFYLNNDYVQIRLSNPTVDRTWYQAFIGFTPTDTTHGRDFKFNCISFLTYIIKDLYAGIGPLIPICHSAALRSSVSCITSDTIEGFLSGHLDMSEVIPEFNPNLFNPKSTGPLGYGVLPAIQASLGFGRGEEPLQKNKRTGKKSIKKSIKRFKNKSRRRKNK